MALLFQEKGSTVSVFDKSKDSTAKVNTNAKEAPEVDEDKITTYTDFKEFMASGKKGQHRSKLSSDQCQDT